MVVLVVVEVQVDLLAAMTVVEKDLNFLALFVTNVVRTVKFLSAQMAASQFIVVNVLKLKAVVTVAVAVVASEIVEAVEIEALVVDSVTTDL